MIINCRARSTLRALFRMAVPPVLSSTSGYGLGKRMLCRCPCQWPGGHWGLGASGSLMFQLRGRNPGREIGSCPSRVRWGDGNDARPAPRASKFATRREAPGPRQADSARGRPRRCVQSELAWTSILARWSAQTPQTGVFASRPCPSSSATHPRRAASRN